jgi:hypothetical protein
MNSWLINSMVISIVKIVDGIEALSDVWGEVDDDLCGDQ